MATDQTAWQPDWAVPPGEILAEALVDRGMTQSELARRMDRPVKTINEIVLDALRQYRPFEHRYDIGCRLCRRHLSDLR